MLKHLKETTLAPRYSAGVWYFYPGASRFHDGDLTPQEAIMLMSAEEVAKLLGVSTKQIYYYCRQGTCPHIRIGRQVKFSSDQIDRWLDAGGTPLPGGRSDQRRGGCHVE